MFHSREINNRINNIHERALRLAYKDYQSSFEMLLRKDGSVTIHHKNLQLLVTEIYKVIHGIAPKIMNEIIQVKESKINLRSDTVFKEKIYPQLIKVRIDFIFSTKNMEEASTK